jgi:hypothetical protein
LRRRSSPLEPLIPDLYGNLEGLKSSQVKSLKALYDRRLPQDRFVTPELARRLTELARELHRQLAVTVDRVGFIEHVIVGDAHQVFIPDLGRARAGEARFRGLRLIVAQLRGEGITKDNLTDLGLLRLDTIVTIAAGIDGLPGDIEYAYALPPEEARAARDAKGESSDNKGLDDTMFRVEKRPSFTAGKKTTRRSLMIWRPASPAPARSSGSMAASGRSSSP